MQCISSLCVTHGLVPTLPTELHNTSGGGGGGGGGMGSSAFSKWVLETKRKRHWNKKSFFGEGNGRVSVFF